MLRLVAKVEAVVRVFGRLAAWTCLALVLLVAGDVLARYFFRAGTIWLQELEWHLIPPIALLGMSYMLLHGEQVRVDVLYERYPPRAKAVVEIASGLLLCAFSLIMIKLALPFVLQSYRIGESSPNPGGLPHRYILKAFIPSGFALLALQSACHVVKNLAVAAGRARPE
ncbi:TRAP transporter small permease subunit [Lutibaculum baratangense]|uniref:TRAP transporter small permease protein n=1 Tax=Lutibaculum baratangense AMV1 TaxID=631454 RepID=V4RLK7_9HYPH|nr:TRAP transporter small permease subunit [Lutibaculum baratangense]ESR26204.1 TRAP dicarboxylate transporter, DctQ subunit, unknown substrate 6 [Lutibaculum baratangense AMV1]